MSMSWKQLLNPDRLGDERPAETTPGRNHYQRDYDRLIFSTAWRRMHGKTQVFPLPESDSVHTRLTHSLEVASVARSLGALVAHELGQGDREGDFASILAAAALAHDLGNPPFGHSGEQAIAEYFDSKGDRFLAGLSAAQKRDFLRFEGNALGFRLLTRNKSPKTVQPGGLRLTYATLGAFVKYPVGADAEESETEVSRKKFGVFQGDTETFRTVANALGLLSRPDGGFCRHPLTFLLEAADDICYRIVDFEDGYRLRLVSGSMVRERLTAIIESNSGSVDAQRLKDCGPEQEQIGYLRARAINTLVFETKDAFCANIAEMMGGRHEKSLLESVRGWNTLKEIKSITKSDIYTHQPVLEIEAAGFEVLGALLDSFLSAAYPALASSNPRTSQPQRGSKVLALIPEEYRPGAGTTQYEGLMAIAEYVASMTDDFAIRTFRRVKGIELPFS